MNDSEVIEDFIKKNDFYYQEWLAPKFEEMYREILGQDPEIIGHYKQLVLYDELVPYEEPELRVQKIPNRFRNKRLKKEAAPEKRSEATLLESNIPVAVMEDGDRPLKGTSEENLKLIKKTKDEIYGLRENQEQFLVQMLYDRKYGPQSTAVLVKPKIASAIEKIKSWAQRKSFGDKDLCGGQDLISENGAMMANFLSPIRTQRVVSQGLEDAKTVIKTTNRVSKRKEKIEGQHRRCQSVSKR